MRVVNLGVGGYTTYNEAGLLRENLSWLQPDLVVVAAFLGNDVAEQQKCGCPDQRGNEIGDLELQVGHLENAGHKRHRGS